MKRMFLSAMTFGLLLLLSLSPLKGEENKSQSQWAPSAGIMLTEFRAGPLDSVIENATGYQPDVRGRSWDVGIARGRPGHSYFRIGYAEINFGSESLFLKGNARYFLDDVKVRGVRVERVFRLGPSRWPVAPMLSLHGGVGQLSGEVRKIILTAPNQAVQRGNVKDLLDTRWFPIAGAGVGFSADIASRLTLTVSVGGIELPGYYFGRIQLVFWPKANR